jgi:hypothetical protein
MNDRIRQQAAIYRAGLAYGVLSPGDAIAWADSLIQSESDVPMAIYELSLAPRDQPKIALVFLRELAPEEQLGEGTVQALLDIVRQRLAEGAETPATAIARAYALTRPLAPESEHWLEAMMLEENYSLASDGIFGTIEEMDLEAREWFAKYAGASAIISERAG